MGFRVIHKALQSTFFVFRFSKNVIQDSIVTAFILCSTTPNSVIGSLVRFHWSKNFIYGKPYSGGHFKWLISQIYNKREQLINLPFFCIIQKSIDRIIFATIDMIGLPPCCICKNKLETFTSTYLWRFRNTIVPKMHKTKRFKPNSPFIHLLVKLMRWSKGITSLPPFCLSCCFVSEVIWRPIVFNIALLLVNLLS